MLPGTDRFQWIRASVVAALVSLAACAGKGALPGAYELQSFSPDGAYSQPAAAGGFGVRLLLTPEAEFSMTVHDTAGNEVTTRGTYAVQDHDLVFTGEGDRGVMRVRYVLSRDGLVLTLPRADRGVWAIDARVLNFKRR
jgi:hypothetical protein